MRRFRLVLNCRGVFKPSLPGWQIGPLYVVPRWLLACGLAGLLGELDEGEHILWG